MYRPNAAARKDFSILKSEKIWAKVQKMYTHYRKKWDGPELPIFIFPAKTGLFSRPKKNGYTFKENCFIFGFFAGNGIKIVVCP